MGLKSDKERTIPNTFSIKQATGDADEWGVSGEVGTEAGLQGVSSE